MSRDPELYRLSEAEHQEIFDNDIKPTLFNEATLTDKPILVIFGGQPGAGKSSIVDAAVQELLSRGGSVQIIGDDLRGFHPAYERLMWQDDKTAAFYTDRDTGRWVEKAIAFAKEQRVNIVIEGTMRDGDKVAATMNTLRDAGYEIDTRLMAVNPRLSEQGILQRYEGQKTDMGNGRMTTPEAHQAGLDGMLVTVERIELDKLADRVSVYRRGPEELYSNELLNGQWKHQPCARSVIEQERNRPMSLAELEVYAAGYQKLAEMVEKRQAPVAEVQHIDNLRVRAENELAAARQNAPSHATIQQQADLELANNTHVVTAGDHRQQHQIKFLDQLRTDATDAKLKGDELGSVVAKAKLAKAESLAAQGEPLTHHMLTIDRAGEQAMREWATNTRIETPSADVQEKDTSASAHKKPRSRGIEFD